ncbi:MAG: Holliday junction branch migration protein RuvA [Eubacteriaceae bacterium]|nr:Holliday junction branch migration protein RuvA [Eubacteriaceae bacterium]
MYEYLIGHIEDVYEDKIVLDCKDIGYLIAVSSNTLSNLTGNNDKVKVYIHQHIREDEMSLYGFHDKQERALFRDLISISGIGPRVSLGILSTFSINDFMRCLSSSDEKAISSAPGIGKKTANRLILELRDKYKNFIPVSGEESSCFGEDSIDLRKDAAEALLSLGYGYAEAMSMVDSIYSSGMSIEDIIKKSLLSASIRA